MRESARFPAWLAAYAAVAAVAVVLPDAFLAFMLLIVGGGMCAVNAGEQLRSDRARGRSA